MTLQQVLQIIRLNKTPYLYLYVNRGVANPALVAKYECTNCTADDTIDEKVEKAIKWLTTIIDQFPADTKFILRAKTSEKANQSGVFGPIDFTIKQQQQPPAGQLAGLDPNALRSLGFIPEAELKAAILERELKYLQEKYQYEIQRIKEDFQNAVEAIKEAHLSWDPRNVTAMIREARQALIDIVNPSQSTKTALSGTPNDPKSMLINSIISELNQLDINKLKIVKEFVLKAKQYGQKTNSGNTGDRVSGETASSAQN